MKNDNCGVTRTVEAEKIRAQLNSTETARFVEIRQELKEEVLKAHGSAISDLVLDQVLEHSLLDGNVSAYIFSGDRSNMLKDMKGIAEDAVQSNEFARIAIQYSNSSLRSELEEIERQKMSLSERMTRFRDGTLERVIKERVDAEIARRN